MSSSRAFAARHPAPRLARLAVGLAAVLAALAVGVSVAASQASTRAVEVKDITIVGTPVLYVQRPVSRSTYNAAWVVFKTKPHLHEPRQLVTELKGHRGRSFGRAGGPDCIRSTVIQLAQLVRPGAKYRVRFYGRRSVGGDMTLLATHTLAAHRWSSTRPVPRCAG